MKKIILLLALLNITSLTWTMEEKKTKETIDPQESKIRSLKKQFRRSTSDLTKKFRWSKEKKEKQDDKPPRVGSTPTPEEKSHMLWEQLQQEKNDTLSLDKAQQLFPPNSPIIQKLRKEQK